MVEIKVHEGHIVNVGIEKLHGYEILCPKCFSRHFTGVSGRGDEFYSLIGKAESHATHQLSCGCVMSLDDLRFNLILIDEWIANSVSRINKAGYLTANSCSGHSTGISNGYLSFKRYHDNLKDYIDSSEFLSRFLQIERYITVDNGEMELRVWDGELKIFTTETVYKNMDQSRDEICVRLKSAKFKSKFEKLQLFRKLLNHIAKWCEENKITKE